MTDELRDRLSRLAEEAPTDRPDVGSFIRRGRRRRRVRLTFSAAATLAVALAVVVPLHGLSGLTGPRPAASSAPPASGYWVRFPDVPTMSADGQNATIDISTNLPDGTLYETSGSAGGGCCPPVKQGQIKVQAQNSSCYGLVGDVGNAPPMSLTITVAPTYDIAFFGLGPPPSDWPPKQPSNVTDVLGANFQNLTGDQVQPLPKGSGNELVASQTFAWPTPQCGGDPLPMFGGPTCSPADYQQQLQGDTPKDAMVDVMGAITQARMCEFWATDLTEATAAAHPWDAFSAEWRRWYLDPPKDFTPSQPGGSWTDSPVNWELVRTDGSTSIVNVTDHGTPILELRIEPLPDFCPGCSPNVVPFWGITDWKFLQS